MLAGVLGMGMTYDGSYYLYRTLEDNAPFIPNRRAIHGLLQTVPLLISRLTDDVGLLQAAAGVSYAGVTVLALLAAWWIVRQRASHLFVWAALGIGIATLPGQVAFISEGAMVAQLAWPLYFAALLGIRRHEVPLVALISGIIFVSHPSALLIFGSAALLSYASWRTSRGRERLVWATVWTLLSIATSLNFALNANPYEMEQLSLLTLVTRFMSSAFGLQLIAVIAASIAGAMLIRRTLPLSPLLWLVLGSMVTWAINPILWIDALSYRFFVIPFSVPFITGAALDHLLNRNALPDWRERGWTIRMVGLTFALTLTIQAVYLVGFTQGLRATLADSPEPCVEMDSPGAKWLRNTLYDHWTITVYSILVQGRTPTKVVLRDARCETSDFSRGVLIATWDLRQWGGGWFNLNRLSQNFGIEKGQ